MLAFEDGEESREIKIKINDDDEWEPDEDFYVDLWDADNMQKLVGGDCTTKITIIDDDKPGDLVFEDKRTHKHEAGKTICRIKVNRIHGSDGRVECDYKTIELDKSTKTATDGTDYEGVSGKLVFEANQV